MKNNLTTSDNGIKLIKDFEGEILKVYADPVGLLTLGVGHLLTPAEKRSFKLGQKITRAESTKFLREDLADAETAVNSSVHVPITQNQFDALVSLTFNIGTAGFKRSSVLRNLNSGKLIHAADAFLLWNKAGGRVISGLTSRRRAERDLFLTRSVSTESELASSNPSSQPSENSVETPDAPPGSATYSEILGAEAEGAAQNTDNLQTAVSQKTTTETDAGKIETTVNQNSFQAEKKDLSAPAPDGSTNAAAKMTIAGITVPAFLVTILGLIQTWITNGVIDLKAIFDLAIKFFTENTRYLIFLIIAFIGFLTVKKLIKQVSFIVNMVLNANPAYHDIRVVPQQGVARGGDDPSKTSRIE